jgi:hypothetical protein
MGFLFPRSIPRDPVLTLILAGSGIFFIWLGLTK